MKLDHVVYFTNYTPEQIVAEQQKLGNHAVIGGRHEKWGTQNALMYVRNAYIEWLSVENIEIAKKAHHQLTALLLRDLKTREGWGTLCISLKGIEQFNEGIKKRGFLTSGVIEASRKTPDGKLRKWKMLFVDQLIGEDLPLPFFIEWEEDEYIRFSNLRKDGVLSPDNEKLEIQECVFHTAKPEKEIKKWADLLSLKAGDANTITLSNVVLRFILNLKADMERMADVVIGSAEQD